VASLGNPWRLVLACMIVACLAAAALAIVLPLRGVDPLGPQLRWSPGVILVIALVVYLLLRGRREP
jgi:hypothetical protein